MSFTYLKKDNESGSHVERTRMREKEREREGGQSKVRSKFIFELYVRAYIRIESGRELP